MTHDTKNGFSKSDLKTEVDKPDLRIQLIAHKYSLMGKIFAMYETKLHFDTDEYKDLQRQLTQTSEAVANYTHGKARDILIKAKLNK